MHWIIYVIIGFIVLILIPMAVKIVAEYERGVIFRRSIPHHPLC